MIEKNKNMFSFRSIEELGAEINRLGLEIPLDNNLEKNIIRFKESIMLEGKEIPNRFCIQPMEGCDGEPDGSPGELSFRRYKRFAQGGAGLIWVEATAVTPEGKANPRQFHINEKSAPKFKQLAEMIRENAVDEKGQPQNPFIVLQLTHSGRYSKPEGKPAPIIFHHSPYLDPAHNLDADYPLISDEELDKLQDKFLTAAKMAYECGFDAIDIKSCHGYLLHEILTAHTRKDSKYGGEFQNRIRFLTEVIEKIKRKVHGLIVTTRLNVYDSVPFPYGWGMKEDKSLEADLKEPVELIRRIEKSGVTMVNVCVGNPYYNPHVERPYDYPVQGMSVPDEHPLKIIDTNIKITGQIKRTFPDMTIVSVGFTWLRELFPHVCSAVLKNNLCDIIGIGRAALANPGFANEIFRDGGIAPHRTCITCSSCSQIMRDGGKSGCVIRDKEVYGDIYRQGRLKNEQYVRKLTQNCRNCWGHVCAENCPAGMDISGFIKAFSEGDIEKAYGIMKQKNILSETCAYTCPTEVQCEKTCTAGILDKNTVPIHEIQKFIAAESRKRGWTKANPGISNGKKIAVIGFGPAGIACSTYLVEKGGSVTVFEASDRTGGIADAVIPSERLPERIIKEEVDSFKLEETGLFEIRYNTKIDKGYSLDNILKEGFDAVFIAAGLSENTGLRFEKKPAGVLPALDFLFKAKRNDIYLPSYHSAAVIGGGNTAMDAACSLVNAGVRDIYLIYRRSYKELPAWPREIEKALKKGVHLLALNQPIEYLEKGEKLAGIKLARTQLGEIDSSGRPAPVVLPGSEYDFPVSICIEATGQSISTQLIEGLTGVELDNGKIKITGDGYQTTREKVYAGGDIVNGGSTVVQAVKEGMEAAEEIYKYLRRDVK